MDACLPYVPSHILLFPLVLRTLTITLWRTVTGGCWRLQHSQVLRIVSTRMLTIKPAGMHGEGSQLQHIYIYIWRMLMHVLPHHDLTLNIVCNSMSHYRTDKRKAEPHAQHRSQHLINTQQNLLHLLWFPTTTGRYISICGEPQTTHSGKEIFSKYGLPRAF